MLNFEWDGRKNRANEKKHGIDFETAQLVFEDPLGVTFVDRSTDGEQHWWSFSRRGHSHLLGTSREFA
jgi:uncharacterized DUF497 family protein